MVSALSTLASHASIMTKGRLIYSLYLVILALWWGWTVLTDFVIVPTVFRHVDIFFQAGELGIAVFSKLNQLEIIVSSILVGLLAYQSSKNKNAFKFLFLGIIACGISLFYFAYLTPKIVEITALWKQADLMGLVSIAGIADIQLEHRFYHNLYIGLDIVKLLIISVMIFGGVYKQEKWT